MCYAVPVQRTPDAAHIALVRAQAERAIAGAEAARARERGHNRPGRKDRLQRAIDELAEPAAQLRRLGGMAKPHGLPENRTAAPLRALSRRLNVERDKLRRML